MKPGPQRYPRDSLVVFIVIIVAGEAGMDF